METCFSCYIAFASVQNNSVSNSVYVGDVKPDGSVVWQMGTDVVKSKSPVSILIMASAFAATCFFGVNVVIVVLVCALLGVVRTLLTHRKEELK